MANLTSGTQGIGEENVTTVLADDLEIKGTMKFKSSLMIKGIFEGEIISEGLLIVGPTAKVTATITTKNLISHGDIKGDVTASEQVILKETAVHTGNITTPNIVLESGSLFNGSCIMQRDTSAGAP
jgi:cytoskeletal protein CcmA (bactofilin family)